ncbi:MAG: hypothetical protein ABEK59_10165 [Halobacteria archaeon]
MTELNDHQQNCADTAIYPGRGSAIGLIYSILGLAGEVGEVANKAKKIIRDDPEAKATFERIAEDYEIELSQERIEKIEKELRGVVYYLPEVLSNLGYSYEEVAQNMSEQLARRAEQGTIHGDGDDR